MGIIAVDIVFMFRYRGSPQVGTGETFLTRSLKGSHTMTMTKEFNYRNLRVELDRNEVYADDPGAGAPAIVSVANGKFSATYWCAINEGALELDGYQLNDKQLDWLYSLEDEINEFLY